MITHRINYLEVQKQLYAAIAEAGRTNNAMALSTAKKNLFALDTQWRLYSQANNDWVQDNTDETMINLIGNWARMTKIMRDMDEKYGVK